METQVSRPSRRTRADHMNMLAFLFPLGLDNTSSRTENFEDADFISITDVLNMRDMHSWSAMPRTYAVLRMIDRIEDMDAFTSQKLSDLSIPYMKDNLPQSLSTSTKTKFLQTQSLVLTSAMDLERGEAGGHKHISSLEDLQFDRVGELGRGGGCTHVEKVWSHVGRRAYAVKYIRRAQYFQNDRKALRDFENELQNAKKVLHHHVVKIVGSFTEELYVGIIMETVGEQNLAQLLRGSITADTRSFLRTYFGCLASGLFAIHQADIKHKDIKPENIIIRKSVVYLTDFGLALDYSTTPENRSTTIGKPAVKHSPLYCAPEWWDWSRRDRRSDIWSIGAVYLEMATLLFHETIPDLFNFLGRHGSQNVLSYSRNLNGVHEWLDFLRSKEKHAHDAATLELVLATMKESIEERPSSYQLWKLVENSAPSGVSYACRACVETFNPSEREVHEPEPYLPATPESMTTTPKEKDNDNRLRSATLINQSSSSQMAFNDIPKMHVQKDESSSLNAQKAIEVEPVKPEIPNVDGDTANELRKPIEELKVTEARPVSPPSEKELLKQEREAKAKVIKEAKLSDLRNFAKSFKLGTPVPSDLITELSRDPKKQQEIILLREQDAAAARKEKSEQASAVPVVPVADVKLVATTIKHLELLFSDKHLAKDYIFRSCMDEEGYVQVRHIYGAAVQTIKDFTANGLVIRRACRESALLVYLPVTAASEIQIRVDCVRNKINPTKWILPVEQRLEHNRQRYLTGQVPRGYPTSNDIGSPLYNRLANVNTSAPVETSNLNSAPALPRNLANPFFTPPGYSIPIPHQHQLPFNLQQGRPNHPRSFYTAPATGQQKPFSIFYNPAGNPQDYRRAEEKDFPPIPIPSPSGGRPPVVRVGSSASDLRRPWEKDKLQSSISSSTETTQSSGGAAKSFGSSGDGGKNANRQGAVANGSGVTVKLPPSASPSTKTPRADIRSQIQTAKGSNHEVTIVAPNMEAAKRILSKVTVPPRDRKGLTATEFMINTGLDSRNDAQRQITLGQISYCISRMRDQVVPGKGGGWYTEGSWTEDEDGRLIRAVACSSPRSWQWVATVVDTRSQGQCKKRWKKLEVILNTDKGLLDVCDMMQRQYRELTIRKPQEASKAKP